MIVTLCKAKIHRVGTIPTFVGTRVTSERSFGEESEAKGYEPMVVLVDQKNKIKRIIKGHLPKGPLWEEEPTDLK